MTSPASDVVELRFPNGNIAMRARERPQDSAVDLAKRLGLVSGRHPVMLVCGGADKLENGQLDRAQRVVGTAVPLAAGMCAAVVIDGGTDSGVMSIVGQARRTNRRLMPFLLGVAPIDLVREPDDDPGDGRKALEPNHTHFALAESADWSGATQLMFSVAEAIAGDRPVAVVLAGGGRSAKNEVLEAHRRQWPLAVVGGSGGLADELIRTRRRARKRRWGSRSAFERVAGSDRLSAIANDPGALETWLAWELTDRPVLKHTWGVFAAYDAQAKRLQNCFTWLQALIICLGIAVTGLGVLYTIVGGTSQRAVHWATLILPSFIALLVTLSARRAIGKRWIVLRAAAEAVKSEAFVYRAGVQPYDVVSFRDEVMADRLAVIWKQLRSTDAVNGPLPRATNAGPPAGVAVETLSQLDGLGYVQQRILDQVSYYHRRAREKSRVRDFWQFVAISMGATGTILAASSAEPAVALTTAISAGAVAYLSSLQFEHDIVVFNQSAGELETKYVDWLAKRVARRGDEVSGELVRQTESILMDEVGDWARRMARALEEDSRRRQEFDKHAGTPEAKP